MQETRIHTQQAQQPSTPARVIAVSRSDPPGDDPNDPHSDAPQTSESPRHVSRAQAENSTTRIAFLLRQGALELRRTRDLAAARLRHTRDVLASGWAHLSQAEERLIATRRPMSESAQKNSPDATDPKDESDPPERKVGLLRRGPLICVAVAMLFFTAAAMVALTQRRIRRSHHA
jgi:hypothetical protein